VLSRGISGGHSRLLLPGGSFLGILMEAVLLRRGFVVGLVFCLCQLYLLWFYDKYHSYNTK
jgi:hypothetical protein